MSVLRLLLIPAVIAAGLPADPPDLTGTWRGTSICVDHAHDTACRDEQVVYRFGRGAHADSIAMHAGKMISGVEEVMGDLELGPDPKTGELAMNFVAPNGFHGRWAFRIAGDRLSGTLVELPGGRLVRRVAARRTGPVPPGS